jgi:N-acetylglutamate synthase
VNRRAGDPANGDSRIRPMEPGDYEALSDIWRSFAGTTMTRADLEEGFRLFLARNGAHCFTCENDGRIAGSVMAGHDTRRGYVYHLAVSSGSQSSGLGRALMAAAEKSLADAGIEKIHLFIYTDNPARSFYERLGWEYRTDIAVMSKVLRRD